MQLFILINKRQRKPKGQSQNEHSKDTGNNGHKINCVHNDSPTVGSTTCIPLKQYLCTPSRQCFGNGMA